MQKDTKVIRDLLYGYIEISEDIEKLINNKHFQRLRDIRQMTSQYVYPSANHTRFEHSLGVYYLSVECLKALKDSLMGNEKLHVKDKEYDKLYTNLSIASLYHDIGHAPLSHLGEHYYRREEIILNLRPLCVNEGIDINIFNKYGAKHEIMSCYIILKYCARNIKNIFKDAVDLELICRMIVGADYDSEDNWLENIGIKILNNTSIDMDKLDYLIRDPFMTGISVPKIDVYRYFKSLEVVDKKSGIIIKKQAITVVQNIIDARDCLYMLVCNHHISVYTDFLFEFYLKHLMIENDNRRNKDKEIKTEDFIDPKDYFSCEAIGEKLVTDNELLAALNKFQDENLNCTDYTKTLVPQIYERKFLKPLWKNIYEYKIFMETYIKDSLKRRKLEEQLGGEEYAYRHYVAKHIIKRLVGDNLKNGEIFIIPRANKFYSLKAKSDFNAKLDTKSDFYISLKDDETNSYNKKHIAELLPQKDFNKLYNDVVFYVFARKDIQNKIKEAFIDIVNEGIPSKEVIEQECASSIPAWLNEKIL